MKNIDAVDAIDAVNIISSFHHIYRRTRDKRYDNRKELIRDKSNELRG